MPEIQDLVAYEILDSRGTPTLRVELCLDKHTRVWSEVPSGASTGKYEACELRDKDPKRYQGKGVLQAVHHVNTEIKAFLIGKNPLEQEVIDNGLIQLDGTKNKSRLGANALLATSLACAKAGSRVQNIPLYEYLLPDTLQASLPLPMVNIINGGAHANNTLTFQEFMIQPKRMDSFYESLRMLTEIFHTLKQILAQKSYSIAVGDEGGFAPALSSHEEALDLMMLATEKAGYHPGDDMHFCLDCAASEFFNPATQRYALSGSREKSADEMINYFENLIKHYPINSIEDPLDQEDWEGWQALTQALGKKVQVVGDDLFVTHPDFLKKGIKQGVANAILIKPNQIGTLSETLQTLSLARQHGYSSIISHRSGETQDSFIADLAAATSPQIKTGSLCRGERIGKYNRLLWIEKNLTGF